VSLKRGADNRLCHIKARRIEEFWEAMERGGESSESMMRQAVTPSDFFSRRELEKIARCERCTYVVKMAYALYLETETCSEMLRDLEAVLWVVYIDENTNQQQRLLSLRTC